jgi:hypothetical protein
MVVVDLEGNVVDGNGVLLPIRPPIWRCTGVIRRLAVLCIPTQRMPLPGRRQGWRSRHWEQRMRTTSLAIFPARALTQAEVEGEYELNTGKVIIETLGEREPLHTPGIVVYQHGPFAWGKDAHDAVHNAVVMEEVARMAWIARGINPHLQGIDDYLMNKHFMRKHGPNAYYGQK